MADFTLPKVRFGREQEPLMRLPRPVDPATRAGVVGNISRLPIQMQGTDTYRAGIDQSAQGEAARAASSLAGQLKGLTVEQQQSLQAHKQYREGLNQAQQQVDTRNSDLRLAQNLLIATDPNGDPAVRKFMLQGLSRESGVDPKGEYSQNIQKMVMGMKPEALEALRGSFTDDIANSPPGMIQKKLNGIFSGDVPIEHVLAQVKEYSDKKAAATAALTSPGLPLTSGAPAGGAAAESAAAPAAAAPMGEFDAAGLPPTKPDTQQRQQVIAAAGLTEAQPQAQPTAAPEAATPPPEVAPPQTVEPSSPIPQTSETGALPETTPAVTPPPVEPAAAAAGEAAGAGAVASPTPTTPPQEPPVGAPPKAPEPTSRMEIPDSLRKAAEETGDKLLLDAIAKVDQRNAVLDSDASHRRAMTARVGAASPSAQAKTPAAPAEPGVEIVTGTPLTLKEGTQKLGRAVLEALPPDPITGIKPSDAFPEDKTDEGLRSVAKNYIDAAAERGVALPPEEKKLVQAVGAHGADIADPEKVPRGVIREITTSKSPGEIHGEDLTRNNEFARRNPAPKVPVEAMKPGERPPLDQEVTGAVKSLGVTKPGERTTYRDVERYLPALPDPSDKEANHKLSEAIVKKNEAAAASTDSVLNISRILKDPNGAASVGGFGRWGVDVTPGEVAGWVERFKSLTGVKQEHLDTLNGAIKKTVEGFKEDAAGKLNPEQMAIASARLEAQLTRFAFARAAVFNPRGTISNADVEAAARTIGNIRMTSPQMEGVLRDALSDTLTAARTEVASRTGRNLGHDWEKLPEDQLNAILAHHVEMGARSPFDPNDIKDMRQAKADIDARRAGQPERENKYIVPAGGPRPEDYERAQTQEAKLAREGKEQHQKIEARKLEIDEEKWTYKKEQDQKQEARQAMLDARHAQEKMAAAFQHIGAMIAGGVKGAHIAGGSGISAGPEDASVFRIAPTPQRRAPQTGGVQVPTRYGGPIKKGMQ